MFTAVDMQSLNAAAEVFIKKTNLMEPSDNAESLCIWQIRILTFDSDFMNR